MPRVRNFSHLVKVGPMATRREPVALRDQLVETIHRIDATQPLMVRSALFARVSNHEATYAAILRDARLRRVPQDEEEMTCCFIPKPFQALNRRPLTGTPPSCAYASSARAPSAAILRCGSRWPDMMSAARCAGRISRR